MSVFTTCQAAEYLTQRGVPYKPQSLEVLRSRKRGPRYYKHGRRVFYLQKDLDAFLSISRPVETIDSLEMG